MYSFLMLLFLMWSLSVWPHTYVHIFISVNSNESLSLALCPSCTGVWWKTSRNGSNQWKPWMLRISWIWTFSGWWRTGCGSCQQSTKRVEELEESVWSVVRQKSEGHGEAVQDSGVLGKDIQVAWKEIRRMLRWMCGVTKLDRNERIWGTTKVGQMKSQRKSRKEGWTGMGMWWEERSTTWEGRRLKWKYKRGGSSVGTIHRCINASRYLSRDSYRDTVCKYRDTL